MTDGFVTVGRNRRPDVAVGVSFDVRFFAAPDEDVVDGLPENGAGGSVVSSGEDPAEEGFVVGLAVVAENGEALGKRRRLEKCGSEIVRTAVVGGPDFVEG